MILKLTNAFDRSTGTFQTVELTPGVPKTVLLFKHSGDGRGIASIGEWGVSVSGGSGKGFVHAELVETKDSVDAVKSLSADDILTMGEWAFNNRQHMESYVDFSKSGYDAQGEGNSPILNVVDRLGGPVGSNLSTRYSWIQKGNRTEYESPKFHIENHLRLRVTVTDEFKQSKDEGKYPKLQAFAWMAPAL